MDQNTEQTSTSKRRATVVPRIFRSTLFRSAITSALVFLAAGFLLYPSWWYTFFFDEGWRNSAHWAWGLNYLLYFGFLPLLFLTLVALVFFSAFRTAPWFSDARRNLHRDLKTIQNNSFLVVLGLIAATLLLTVEPRSRETRRQEKEWAESQKRMAALTSSLIDKQPQKPPLLSKPTTFFYISEGDVNSLYSQYEPELVLSSAAAEVQNSLKIDGTIGLEGILKTEAGAEQIRKMMVQYQQTVPTTERKLNRLVSFLLKNDFLAIFDPRLSRSEQLRTFEEAVSLLRGKYSVDLNDSEVRKIRDRLADEDLRALEQRLTDLRGHLVIDGEWTLQLDADVVTFEYEFEPGVTGSPTASFEIRRDQVSTELVALSAPTTRPTRVRLTVFGSVVAPFSVQQRSVRVRPIAVF
jgi:hypothetical protein